MEQMRTSDLAVIVVLFNPSEEDISNVTNLAAHYYGVIVDNSEKPISQNGYIGLMHYVCNGKNRGIAAAQNTAIDILIKDDIKYLVFLDQDSRINIDYPLQIVNAFMRIKVDISNLVLLGPTVLHKHNGQEYASVVHKDDKTNPLFTPRRDVISSGCCISVDAIGMVGCNDSRLFIDYVDYEWCWRAKSKGFVCGITPLISIKHRVGQRELHIGKFQVIISHPFRYYYQYRNYLWLLRKKYVPLQWKVATGAKMLLRMLYFPFCVEEWKEIERNMFRGIYHGLLKSKS